ncbi:ribosome biogenesis GTPase [Pelomonas saccharophila]|uniref:Small ribosomal subunit biogenesis GTPase RsgA n=1 Tax=Roseateles saccharophilus TaxID=304 RepID=A0ABU1YIJ3_ROSSA|nr:ribosome small subunit-dependent GTPase A [Roseateles saccharophilus]MDR7268669.1 ribosome biogenesis GTPase [Roseateles saccharophilus]
MEFEFETLRALGLTQAVASRVAQLPTSDLRLARVIEAQRDCYTLHDGRVEQPARALPRLVEQLQARAEPLTIGDWVGMQVDVHGQAWVVDRVDPVTQIARRANDGRRQPLASNVDAALLVMGLDADFNSRRMERYIAMVRASEVAPVVVLTKLDIAPNARERVAEMHARLPATVPVLSVNALSRQACTEIGPWLHAGQTLVLLGSSGAGKSTLINTLAGAGQLTGGVRSSDGRGRHTTTARSMHRCAQGGCIIDTPGLRTFRPDADAQTLAATFDDVQALAHQCRFRDCRHESEPGCAVRAQVNGDRLDNYKKLMRDAQRGDMTPLERIEQRSKWKTIRKAGSQRAREKRT